MTPFSLTLNSFLRKASLLSLALLLYGLGLSVGTAEAQPYGSLGWCNPSVGCTGTISVSNSGDRCTAGSGPATVCPYPGLGCTVSDGFWSGGLPCGQCLPNRNGVYHWEGTASCASSGGGGGGGGGDPGGGGGGGCSYGVSPSLSYSCNAAGTRATLSWSGGTTYGGYALRINDPTTPWTGQCPAASPDFCGNVSGSSHSFDTVPGRVYGAWIHSYDVCCGSFGCSYTPTAVPTSINVTCSPPAPPVPVPDLYINGSNGPLTVLSGTNLNLTWGAVANATSCTATAGAGWATVAKSAAGGDENVPATATTVYTLSCTGAGGTGTDSVAVAVNAPPPPIPPNPALSYHCDSPSQVTISWTSVPTATLYPLRVNDTSNGWGPSSGQACNYYSGDECYDTANLSYTRNVTPGQDYQVWAHACNVSGCSPGVGTNPFPFRCDYPPVTVRGRITNQSGVGIPGVTIPACASNPGAITDASGNYSFTVPHDARFCIRPNTPAGMNSNPLLSGLQPSQQAIHTYEWQVAGWNAGVHPFCDNFDSINRIPASCDEWKQWDRGVDTGYDFAYSPISPPIATLDLNPGAINIHPTVNQKATLTWGSSGNATSCTGTNFNTNGALSGSLIVSPGSQTTYSVFCTGPGGNSPVVSRTLNVFSTCIPAVPCESASDICKPESCTDSCGEKTIGTKDCRRFWKEVAP